MPHTQKFHIAGVMGWPVMHSRSPRMHNHWLQQYGLPGAYLPLPIEPGKLAPALRALPALNFSGVNLTIPHKEAALSVVDTIDPAAKKIGAINCVVVEKDGSLIGQNHDAYGYVASLRESAPHWQAHAGPAVVIGAGGGARAVIYGLLEAGATEVRIVNRTLERAQALAAEFGPAASAHAWESRNDALAGAALLVNTTSNGMIGQPPLDLKLDALPHQALVSDIVYAPLETPLLAEARVRGNPIVGGIGMLIHQARPAFRAWFGVLPDVTPALRQIMEATV